MATRKYLPLYYFKRVKWGNPILPNRPAWQGDELEGYVVWQGQQVVRNELAADTAPIGGEGGEE